MFHWVCPFLGRGRVGRGRSCLLLSSVRSPLGERVATSPQPISSTRAPVAARRLRPALLLLRRSAAAAAAEVRSAEKPVDGTAGITRNNPNRAT
jgi:hypothetical protein